jgi:lytic murein transglycosylase
LRRSLSNSLAMLGLLAGVLCSLCSGVAQADDGFQKFLDGIWPEAKRAGVSRATFDATVKGLKPDYSIPDLAIAGRSKVENRGQAEFTKTAADYMPKAYMEKLAANGRVFFKQHAAALKKIEKATGVDPYIVVAIWGRETAYGSYKLPHDAIRVLATLSYAGKRKERFRPEFVAALKMLQVGVARSDMKSSWAGAVGLTQFMPTEFFKFAADGDGDGRVDIFRSVPDALASAARQLEGKGWVRGVPWGYEVKLGPKSDCALEGPPDERLISEWMKLGFRPAKKSGFSANEQRQNAYLMSPAGAYGPAFLVTDNFKVIRLYNTSDLYALFVGHLSDRIRGGGDFASPWKPFAQPRARTVHDLQAQLIALGYALEKTDGKIGSNTRKQIGLYQRAKGITVDCWPSDSLLTHANAQAARP